MGRPRSSLTPMIGLSLAALVAGSLVTLAVLAQRVSLDVPLGAPVLPHAAVSGEEVAPLVVDNAPPSVKEGLDAESRRDLDLPPDRVLPLRIAQAAAPARKRHGKGGAHHGRKPPREQPSRQRAFAHSLPPGITKKVNRGGEIPPGHQKRAVTGGKSHPPEGSKSRGRGVCGEPPCGHARGHRD